MSNRKLIWLTAIGMAIFLMNCNKASDLQGSIGPDDEIPVHFTEMGLHLSTIDGDSILTYNDSLNTGSLLSGSLIDPVFGITNAIIYTQFIPVTVPDFSGAELDSVVLSLAFDTILKGYGNFETPQSFYVYRMRERLSSTENYYSNVDFEVDPSPLGQVTNITPRPDSSVAVVEPDGEIPDTNILLPQIRVKLTEAFGQELLQYDTSVYSSPASFLENLNGLAVFPGDPASGLVYFNLHSQHTALNLYYSKADTGFQYQIRVTLTGVKVSRYVHDYSGTIVQQALNDQTDNDSVAFLQSLGGTNVQIKIPDIDPFADKSINNATIELFVAYLPIDDTSAFRPIEQTILFEETDNRGLIIVEDAGDYFGLPNEFPVFFGGNLMTDSGMRIEKYEMTITKHLQKIVNGESTTSMILFNLNTSNNAARTILNGFNQSEFGAKLNVTYSDFN